MGRDETRAGDGDRQAVADRLRAALDEGRLDLHEYDERLQQTYAAKIYGELDALLADIPGTLSPQQSQVRPHQAAAPVPAPAVQQSCGRANRVAPRVRSYTGLIVVSVAVTLVIGVGAGHAAYFWPVWLLIPLIFGITGALKGKGSSAGSSEREARRAVRRERRRR